MKKYLYMAIGASALLFGACSQDEEPTTALPTRAFITVNSPEMLTRSDGSDATTLQYALYDIQSDGSMVQVGDPTEITDASYPLSLEPLDVVTGHTYGILFWASAPASPYTVDWTDGEMTVDYESVKANTTSLDAFFAYEQFTVNGNVNLSVIMERPFAKINIGSSEPPADGAESSISVTNVPTGINLFTGDLLGTTDKAVVFASAAVPTTDMTYPVAGYNYLAFAYVLAPKTASTGSDISYTYTAGETAITSKTVNNVTLRANYQINIYGSLLNNN